MRHGTAKFHQGKDFDRPLHAQAKGEFERVSQQLKKLNFAPTYILVSAALRTEQTLEWWKKNGQMPFKAVTKKSLYLASAHQIEQILLNELSDREDEQVLLIGHNPGISDWVFNKLSSCNTSFMGFPTAGLVELYWDIENWSAFPYSEGILSNIIYP